MRGRVRHAMPLREFVSFVDWFLRGELAAVVQSAER